MIQSESAAVTAVLSFIVMGELYTGRILYLGMGLYSDGLVFVALSSLGNMYTAPPQPNPFHENI